MSEPGGSPVFKGSCRSFPFMRKLGIVPVYQIIDRIRTSPNSRKIINKTKCQKFPCIIDIPRSPHTSITLQIVGGSKVSGKQLYTNNSGNTYSFNYEYTVRPHSDITALHKWHLHILQRQAKQQTHAIEHASNTH